MQETWKGIRQTRDMVLAVKSPLTVAAIRDVDRACPNTLIGRCDRLLALVGFTGRFRRSEVASIELDDLTFAPNVVSDPTGQTPVHHVQIVLSSGRRCSMTHQ